MADENLLKKYAELVVRVGANVGEGQDVAISAFVEHAPFVRALTASAYEAGARSVTALYGDQYVKRELIIHGSEDVLEWSPPWEFERLEYFARVGGATIAIAGDPNPDVFADLDGVRVGKARPKALGERALQITSRRRASTGRLRPTRTSAGRGRSSASLTSTASGGRWFTRFDSTSPTRSRRGAPTSSACARGRG
jgi:hypothetical protein